MLLDVEGSSTASSAESVCLVVALAEAGCTLRYSIVSFFARGLGCGRKGRSVDRYVLGGVGNILIFAVAQNGRDGCECKVLRCRYQESQVGPDCSCVNVKGTLGGETLIV